MGSPRALVVLSALGAFALGSGAATNVAEAEAPAPDFLPLFETTVGYDPLGRELRRLQTAAGNRPVLLPDGWNALGDAVLELGAALPTHGVTAELAAEARRTRLTALAEELLATEWTGRPVDDVARARTLLEAERLLAEEALSLARLLDADRPLAPYARWGVQRRLLHAMVRWQAPEVLLRTFWPAFDDYDHLRAGLARYRAIEAAGGFVSLPKTIRRARSQKEHASVIGLRKRLAQEHPVIEVTDDRFWGDDVDDALANARAMYQLRERPRRRRLDRALRKALAVPVAERIATIERDLARLRTSPRNDHGYLVYVNLPAYRGEVWHWGKRLHEFNVVVGGRRRINKTPELTSAIHTIVFNPYWNVPRRIYETEMKGAAEKWVDEGGGTEHADYWEGKGYELMGRNPKTQWLRRPPGPGNPLGRVKFLFENRHAVFLHDTPARKLFRKPRRAFSHGCIRVQDPMDLAELLLRRDGSWDEAERAGVRHQRRTRVPVRLQRPVPVVLDYVTSEADEAGHMTFFSDMYRRNRRR